MIDAKTLTVDQLNEKCKVIKAKRQELDALKEVVKEKDAEVDRLQFEMIEILNELNLGSFDFGEGVIEKRMRMSVKVPQGENREEFFKYLKERKIFDFLITVNSQTLNSWYKDEHKNHSERGEAFFPPGLEMPTANFTLALKKK